MAALEPGEAFLLANAEANPMHIPSRGESGRVMPRLNGFGLPTKAVIVKPSPWPLLVSKLPGCGGLYQTHQTSGQRSIANENGHAEKFRHVLPGACRRNLKPPCWRFMRPRTCHTLGKAYWCRPLEQESFEISAAILSIGSRRSQGLRFRSTMIKLAIMHRAMALDRTYALQVCRRHFLC